MNTFPQFKALIIDDDGKEYSIHFAALFSKRDDAVPVLLLHGWPGTHGIYTGQRRICCLISQSMYRKLPRVSSHHGSAERHISSRVSAISRCRPFSPGLRFLIAAPARFRFPPGGRSAYSQPTDGLVGIWHRLCCTRVCTIR